MKNKKIDNKIVVYQAKSGAIELKRDSNADTLWASLDQIASLFGRDKSKEGELTRNSVVAFFATTAAGGSTDLSGKAGKRQIAL